MLEQAGIQSLVAAGLIAGLAVALLFVRRRRTSAPGGSGDASKLFMVLNNMTQGVILFDANERIVVCNERYIDMYGLSRKVVKPGCTLVELIESRRKAGSLKIDTQKYRMEIIAAVREGRAMSRIVETPDGRAISVINKPIENGKYWIGTHDDITEKIQAERTNAALSEQGRRRTELESEILTFRENVETSLQTVSEGTNALKSISDALSNSAGRTSERATTAVHTSNEASANVTTAAGAAEELMVSIAEIGQQVSQAAELVRHSVTEASATNDQMSRLTETVQEIGDVVNLIRDIAEQTNLLALNATIEAARAGDAGRGFAVVASEVKSLAVQTAKATEQIAGQIEAVQKSTQNAVDAIRRNTERMREIDGYTSAVARSLDQQDSATGEISRNVSSAADAAKVVVGVLGEVTKAVDETRIAAGSMLGASDAVDSAAAGLQKRIEGFLSRVAV